MAHQQSVYESPSLGVILPKTELHKTSRNVIDSVRSHIFDYLNATGLPELDVLCCYDTTCSSSEHKSQIDVLYSHVISCLTNAVSASIGQKNYNSSNKKTIPGWNEFVLDAKETATGAYKLWQQWNKPKHGPVFLCNAAFPCNIQICHTLLQTT